MASAETVMAYHLPELDADAAAIPIIVGRRYRLRDCAEPWFDVVILMSNETTGIARVSDPRATCPRWALISTIRRRYRLLRTTETT